MHKKIICLSAFLLFVIIIVTLFALLIKQSDWTANANLGKDPVQSDWLIVPVFYVTNRASSFTDKANLYTEKSDPNGLHFGVKNFAVPVPINSPLNQEAENQMGWQRIHTQLINNPNSPEFDRSKCVIKDKIFSRDEIISAFDDYRASAHNPENIIYVHGCCAVFETVMERAAMVATHTQAPVLVYDWVSPKGFEKYLENETMIEQALDDFCRFIAKVETIIAPKYITFIGHSMGAKLVDQAMARRAQLIKINSAMPKFKEIIMANADVDVLAFLKHGNELTSNAENTRIYFSTNDDRLRFSKFVHGGFPRLGSPGDLISELIKIKNMQCIDITANNTGHDLPYWLVANMHKYNSVGPAEGFALKKTVPGYLLLIRFPKARQKISQALDKCICTEISSHNHKSSQQPEKIRIMKLAK